MVKDTSNCANVPFAGKTWDWFEEDEVSILSSWGLCLVFFYVKNCASSLNKLPVVLDINATNPIQKIPVEYNVTENAFWSDKNLKVKSITNCSYCITNQCSVYGQPETLRISNSSDNGSGTVPLSSSVIIVSIGPVVFVSVCAFVAYVLFQQNMKNQISQEEIDSFYDGSDKPRTSTEDTNEFKTLRSRMNSEFQQKALLMVVYFCFH